MFQKIRTIMTCVSFSAKQGARSSFPPNW